MGHNNEARERARQKDGAAYCRPCLCRWHWSQGYDRLRVPQVAPLQKELGHRDLAGVQCLDAHRPERILIHVHCAEHAEVGQGTEDARHAAAKTASRKTLSLSK